MTIHVDAGVSVLAFACSTTRVDAVSCSSTWCDGKRAFGLVVAATGFFRKRPQHRLGLPSPSGADALAAVSAWFSIMPKRKVRLSCSGPEGQEVGFRKV